MPAPAKLCLETAGVYGLPFGFHSGRKSESASQRTGPTMDAMEWIMKSKSRWAMSSEGWW